MLRLVTERVAPPARDTAVSAALLHAVAAGAPDTLRLWTPDRSVAFGRQDRVRPGYRAAVAASSDLGYAPVERLAGGRAAVFHEDTLAFSWALADADPRTGVTARFAAISGIVTAALAALGGDARIGEVPGEYCPGDWSVNLGGTHKVMGVGQRLVRGAVHLGGVIVVAGADRVNRPLVPVYEALGYVWRPEATGAIVDHLPGVTTDDVAAALSDAFAAAGHPTVPGTLDDAVLADAARRAADHDPR